MPEMYCMLYVSEVGDAVEEDEVVAEIETDKVRNSGFVLVLKMLQNPFLFTIFQTLKGPWLYEVWHRLLKGSRKCNKYLDFLSFHWKHTPKFAISAIRTLFI